MPPGLFAESKVLAFVLATLSCGCASHTAEPTRRGASSESGVVTVPPSAGPQPSALATVLPAPTPEPTLLLTDPTELAALERRGLRLVEIFGGQGDASTNRDLSLLPRFAVVVSELSREIAAVAAADKLAGVDVAKFSHRVFDARFLSLPRAHFTLAGVVSRPDRAPFGAASCGETRLVYRLAYALDAERASKLPMTLGIELQVPREPDGCVAAAKRWLVPNGDAEQRAAWLRSDAGPLSPQRVILSRDNARVVVNLQIVRWPSTVRPDLGGHAEYLLRAFRPGAEDVLTPERLENTPDPSSLRNVAARQKLAAWLSSNSEAVDSGTATLPAEFLATRAISVTPRGLKRLANRPFSALRSVPTTSNDFSRNHFVKSPAGLLRRLDQLSCQGCHEARSVAGFHLLGEDAADSPAENALAVAVSPHVTADLPRRLAVWHAMLRGTEPDFAAPFGEHPGSGGGYGEACALAQDATFAGWSCAPGLQCSRIEASADDNVGQCLPASATVGDACEVGSVTQDPNRLRDRIGSVALASCGDMVCNRSAVGFPGGMCTASCGAPNSSCGSIAILDSFNACLARGNTFLSCIRGNVRPAGLRPCDGEHACRDDYVCARSGDGGVCLPPYFVFQLRVDGHASNLR